MPMIKDIWNALMDRRRRTEPVKEERRTRKRMQQADEQLGNALDGLTTVVLQPRGRKPNGSEFAAINDPQQTVIFSTLQHICQYATSGDFAVRFCRNPKHECANSIATCNEHQCPLVRAKAAA